MLRCGFNVGIKGLKSIHLRQCIQIDDAVQVTASLPTIYYIHVPPTKEEVYVFARVRLSACLSVCL